MEPRDHLEPMAWASGVKLDLASFIVQESVWSWRIADGQCAFFFFGHKGTGWIVSPSSKMTHSSGMGLITLIGEREKDLEGRASSLMAVVPQLSSLLWSSDHPGIGGMGQFQCAGMVFVASAFELWPYFFFFLSRCLQCNPPFVVANSGLMLLEYVVWSLCERVLLISQN